MRTTLDLPDALFRQLKARAALEGLSLKELIARYVSAGLQRPQAVGAGGGGDGQIAEPGLARDVARGLAPDDSAFAVLQDGAGIMRSGVRDLATNPRHMDGFGRD